MRQQLFIKFERHCTHDHVGEKHARLIMLIDFPVRHLRYYIVLYFTNVVLCICNAVLCVCLCARYKRCIATSNFSNLPIKKFIVMLKIVMTPDFQYITLECLIEEGGFDKKIDMNTTYQHIALTNVPLSSYNYM